jgi:hypothetical protein
MSEPTRPTSLCQEKKEMRPTFRFCSLPGTGGVSVTHNRLTPRTKAELDPAYIGLVEDAAKALQSSVLDDLVLAAGEIASRVLSTSDVREAAEKSEMILVWAKTKTSAVRFPNTISP